MRAGAERSHSTAAAPPARSLTPPPSQSTLTAAQTVDEAGGAREHRNTQHQHQPPPDTGTPRHPARHAGGNKEDPDHAGRQGESLLGGAIDMAASSLHHHDWQQTIALRIAERDQREAAHHDIIANYEKLARHARLLQQRAAGRGGQTSSSIAPSQATAAQPPPSPVAPPTPSLASTGVDQAHVRSLDAQLSTLRSELAAAYKSQSQASQRLLELQEQRQTREDEHRRSETELNALRQERDRAARRERDLKDASGEKDRVIELLQDELRTLSLELNQVEARNDDLKRDNASLLQRWLDRARQEAERVNEANNFVEEIERRKRAAASAGGASESTTPPNPAE
ncbi:unnamed protein product [Parajaminaea phylloscopi]